MAVSDDLSEKSQKIIAGASESTLPEPLNISRGPRIRGLILSLLFATFAFGASAAPDNREGPKVLVSIAPIYSIVANVMQGSSVMQGSGRVASLLKGGESPHTRTLEPSDEAKLADADVIFWVGPALEKFLIAPLANLAAHARIVTLSDAEGIRLLPPRTGSSRDNNTEPNNSDRIDGHIWLDPNNGIAIARATARVLGEINPEYARLYMANAEAFAVRTKFLDSRLAQQLRTARGRPFIVFHDGYQYFEAHYGLTSMGGVAVAPDDQLDALRIEAIRAQIKSTGAKCLLSTREISPQLSLALTAGLQVRTAAVGALGINIPRGIILYQTLLSRIATTLVSCLTVPQAFP